MKDTKSILLEIKDLLFGKEYKDIKSGENILRVDEMKEEATVVLVTPEGLMPVLDGEYETEEGILEIEAGKIKKIKMEKDLKFAEAELADGTKVRVDGDLSVGKKVEVEVNGEFVKAPEGKHTLSDGKVIYVDAEGLINEIETEATAEIDLEVEANLPPYVKEDDEIIKEKPELEDVLNRLVKLEEVIEELKSYKENMKKVDMKLESFIKDTPAELEFKSVKTEFSNSLKGKEASKKDNLEAIRQLRTKK
jgi:hypothetical protein